MGITAFRTSGQKKQEYEVTLNHASAIFTLDVPHVSLRFAIPQDNLMRGSSERPKSERFLIAIEQEAFADVAREMMKADPQAAIRAFGKAMQEFEIQALDEGQAA